jgi:hypothetical protein
LLISDSVLMSIGPREFIVTDVEFRDHICQKLKISLTCFLNYKKRIPGAVACAKILITMIRLIVLCAATLETMSQAWVVLQMEKGLKDLKYLMIS